METIDRGALAWQEARQRIATLAAGLSVGDILHKRISWESTANFFYQVVAIDDKTVSYRLLKANLVSEVFGYGHEFPVVDNFSDDVIIEKDKRWLGQFVKWDGRPPAFTYAN